jgi:peptidoglycan/LPS O-acetylase OafA/YrhL
MNNAPAFSSRIASLDGLRGVAAFIVIISHLVVGFFPALYFGAEGHGGHAIQDAIAKSPLFVLYSGTFAVYVFFVLSGFVIAASAARTRSPLPLLIAVRYARLTIPILVSVCFAYLMVHLLPGAAQRAAHMVGHWWLDFMYQPMDLPFSFAVKEGAYTVYLTGLSYYNNVLWTMRVEFAGSVAIYVVYAVCGRSVRVPALGLFSLVTCFAIRDWPTNLMGFFLGALMFEAWTRGFIARNSLLGAGLVLAGLFLGGLPFAPAEGSVYEGVSSFVEAVSPAFSTVRAAGATALILGLFMWKRAGCVFEARMPQFFGRISFALYLIHFPLLCIGMSELYWRFGQQGSIAMAAIASCYVAVTIAVAYAMTVLVDEPTVRALALVRKAWPFRSGARAAA